MSSSPQINWILISPMMQRARQFLFVHPQCGFCFSVMLCADTLRCCRRNGFRPFYMLHNAWKDNILLASHTGYPPRSLWRYLSTNRKILGNSGLMMPMNLSISWSLMADSHFWPQERRMALTRTGHPSRSVNPLFGLRQEISLPDLEPLDA